MRLEFGIGGPVSCERLSGIPAKRPRGSPCFRCHFWVPAETATGVDKDGQVPTAPVLGSFRGDRGVTAPGFGNDLEQGHASARSPRRRTTTARFITLDWGYLRPVSEVTLLLDAIEAGEP